MSNHALANFLQESLMIEGILRDPTMDELKASARFLDGELSLAAVVALQVVYAPDKPLRDREGMNVRVAKHIAPAGGPDIPKRLDAILTGMRAPYRQHVEFELLHPFMDGNGRTGRAVWAWSMLRAGMDPFAIGFLHRFYYQTLSDARSEP